MHRVGFFLGIFLVYCSFFFFFLRVVEPVTTQLAVPAAQVSDPGVPFQDANTVD